jgi:choice-of-anchor A domain-containing protein
MKVQRIFDSFAAGVCLLGLVFACGSADDPPGQATTGAGSTTGDGADTGVGGPGTASTGGKSSVLKDGGDDDDDTGTGADGTGAAAGDDDDDTSVDDDDDTSVDDDDDSAAGGTGGSGSGYAGEEYNPDQGGVGTDDPGHSTDDPGTGGGNTEDPGTGGGNTDDPPQGGDTGDPGTGGDTGDPGTGGATADPPDECVITDIMAVNVIVFGDATPSGADSEGTMYIEGDATFSGYGIGSKNTKDCDSWSLVVGGDLNGSGNANNGKIWVGGEYNATINFTDCGVSQVQPGPVDFDALEQKMIGICLALAAYPVNGTVDEGGSLKLIGTDPKMNVFSVTAEQIELATEIVIDVPTSSTVIVNVSGEDIVFSGKGFKLPDGASCRGGSTDFCSHIVWNMPEAKTLKVSGIGIQGSVYAPFAVFSGSGGNIDGQLVVKELTGGIEFHPYFFNGCIELPPGVSLSG